MVADSTRTQVSPLEVIPGAELEAADVCVTEVSHVLVLSAVIEVVEADKVDARRVGDASRASVEFSPEGLLDHEPPAENKAAEGTEQITRKERGEVRGPMIAEGESSAKDKGIGD